MKTHLIALAMLGAAACTPVATDPDGPDTPVDADPTASPCDASDWYADADGDGFGDEASHAVACEGPEGFVAIAGDCDDHDADAYPDAPEACDAVDNDCDGIVDDAGGMWFYDEDGDGWGDATRVTQTCTPGQHLVAHQGDCDDLDPGVNPSAPELCDAVDNDCNGAIDDDAADATIWYADFDADGFGQAQGAIAACDQPRGYVATGGDCDDTAASAHPGADEICDGADQDCDGIFDERAIDASTYYFDGDGDGYGGPETTIESCSQPAGYTLEGSDCDDADPTISPATVWYADADADGVGTSESTTASCLQPEGFAASSGDCDDADAHTYSGAPEACDGIDRDCNGFVDDAPVTGPVWYADTDADGHGSEHVSVVACSQPAGFIDSSDDCNDQDSASFPGAPEICDGWDNDCNGSIDEGDPESERIWYADGDGDGYGSDTDTVASCTAPAGYVGTGGDCDDSDPLSSPDAIWFADADADGHGSTVEWVQSCAAPQGYVAFDTDCNDLDDSVYPGAPESCDAIDHDCDGFSVQGAVDAKAWFVDVDGDGFGTGEATFSCHDLQGWVEVDGDCDDTASAISPVATEQCDGVDQDCDGSIDNEPTDGLLWYADADGDGFGIEDVTTEACQRPDGFAALAGDCDDGSFDHSPATWWYEDADGDGFGGDATEPVQQCEQPQGFVTFGGDCDDAEAATYPGAVEVCDDIDNNCNLEADEPGHAGMPQWYFDNDADGFGDSRGFVYACEQIPGLIVDAGDCDDDHPGVHPGAVEICNGVDNDCDGIADNNDPWWDTAWSHRVPVHVTAPTGTFSPVVLSTVDFGAVLVAADQSAVDFDPASIRVVSAGCDANFDHASQFVDGIASLDQPVDHADPVGDAHGTVAFVADFLGIDPAQGVDFHIYFDTLDKVHEAPEYPSGVAASTGGLTVGGLVVAFDETAGGTIGDLALDGGPTLLSQADSVHGNGIYTPTGALLTTDTPPASTTVIADGPVIAVVESTGTAVNNDAAFSYTHTYWVTASDEALWTKTAWVTEIDSDLQHGGDWTAGVRPWQTVHDDLKKGDTVYEADEGEAFVAVDGWGVRWGFVAAPSFHYNTRALNGATVVQANDVAAAGEGPVGAVSEGTWLVDHAVALVVPGSDDPEVTAEHFDHLASVGAAVGAGQSLP